VGSAARFNVRSQWRGPSRPEGEGTLCLNPGSR
jgi:hypothetical protein